MIVCNASICPRLLLSNIWRFQLNCFSEIAEKLVDAKPWVHYRSHYVALFISESSSTQWSNGKEIEVIKSYLDSMHIALWVHGLFDIISRYQKRIKYKYE